MTQNIKQEADESRGEAHSGAQDVKKAAALGQCSAFEVHNVGAEVEHRFMQHTVHPYGNGFIVMRGPIRLVSRLDKDCLEITRVLICPDRSRSQQNGKLDKTCIDVMNTLSGNRHLSMSSGPPPYSKTFFSVMLR